MACAPQEARQRRNVKPVAERREEGARRACKTRYDTGDTRVASQLCRIETEEDESEEHNNNSPPEEMDNASRTDNVVVVPSSAQQTRHNTLSRWMHELGVACLGWLSLPPASSGSRS
jgi:hypothetical protein